MTSREQKLKITIFAKVFFSVITFDSVKTRHSFCQQRIFLLETRRTNYNLTLKGNFENENLTSGQGHDLIGKGRVAYQSIRMVVLNTSIVLSLL